MSYNISRNQNRETKPADNDIIIGVPNRAGVSPWSQRFDVLRGFIRCTAAEIVALLDGHFGNTDWRTGGSGGGGGGGTTLPPHNQVEERSLFSRAGILFWKLVNEVPNTPGTTTGIGSVVTATGENDRDYGWRKLHQILTLATGSGLEFNSRNELTTTPSLVGTANTLEQTERALEELGDLQSVGVSTATSYSNTLDSQATSAKPLLLDIMADISGNYAGNPYSWSAGQILWFPPCLLYTSPSPRDS